VTPESRDTRRGDTKLTKESHHTCKSCTLEAYYRACTRPPSRKAEEALGTFRMVAGSICGVRAEVMDEGEKMYPPIGVHLEALIVGANRLRKVITAWCVRGILFGA